MNRNNEGKSKTVLKFLGFLIDEYRLDYLFQKFDKYSDFYGPIHAYSFYNDYGCFTLLEVVQRGEWAWYVSEKIYTNLEELLETEIKQTDYIQQQFFSYKTCLKVLGDLIRQQLEHSQQFFGIVVKKQN